MARLKLDSILIMMLQVVLINHFLFYAAVEAQGNSISPSNFQTSSVTATGQVVQSSTMSIGLIIGGVIGGCSFLLLILYKLEKLICSDEDRHQITTDSVVAAISCVDYEDYYATASVVQIESRGVSETTESESPCGTPVLVARAL